VYLLDSDFDIDLPPSRPAPPAPIDDLAESLPTAIGAPSLLDAVRPLLDRHGSFSGPTSGASSSLPVYGRRVRAWHEAAALQGSCLCMWADTPVEELAPSDEPRSAGHGPRADDDRFPDDLFPSEFGCCL